MFNTLCNQSEPLFTTMPALDTIVGQNTDIISCLFLMAPLPNLPCPRCPFQSKEVNEAKMDCSHLQLIECYHTIANVIEAGFSANATLLPLAWIRVTSDLIACILQGVLTMRNFGPDGKPININDFKNLFDAKD
jgi:hypothetical protein